jgi:hypothetical protein
MLGKNASERLLYDRNSAKENGRKYALALAIIIPML